MTEVVGFYFGIFLALFVLAGLMTIFAIIVGLVVWAFMLAVVAGWRAIREPR